MAVSESRKLVKAISDFPSSRFREFNGFPRATAYSEDYAYPLRSNTITPAVKMAYPIVDVAAASCGVAPDCAIFDGSIFWTKNCFPNYRLIKSGSSRNQKVYAEVINSATEHLLVSAEEQSDESVVLRMSVLTDQGANSACGLDFTQLSADSNQIFAITLALWPFIETIDAKKGNSLIAAHVTDMGNALATYKTGSAPWASHPNYTTPEGIAFSKAAYFVSSAATIILKDHLTIDCGPAGTNHIQEVSASTYANGPIIGKLVSEQVNATLPFWFVEAGQEAPGLSDETVTIKAAKAYFSSYSADRNWTAQERMLIPQFADDTPVMPETLRIARRILNTEKDVNPVINIMWRGVTSYGKSTGIQQLACILNMPILKLTCHPGMEAQDFKSLFVPAGSDVSEGIPLDAQNFVAGKVDAPETDPLLADAMAHYTALSAEEQEKLLDLSSFTALAMMDTDCAAQTLLGKAADMSPEELCALYARFYAEVKLLPMREKLAQAEALAAKNTEGKGNQPEFVHVVSPYLKAMTNGYLCEIQEASRIRDSGVLVSINEFDRAGAVLPLMNGALVKRHSKAICVITDNVGYASCRPIDPSVIRRQGLILDSYNLTKEQLMDRVIRNTGVTDLDILETCYNLWNCVKTYCEQNSITEGSVSPTEFERLVQATKYDGMDYVMENLDACVISKASSDLDEQRDIRAAVNATT